LGGDGVTTPTSRTPEQTTIAQFWADGVGTETPPGHWNQIAEDVARARGTTLVQNARLFALLDLALADAAIVAWDCKYVFNYWRPVTAIRNADTDGNPDTSQDATWTPLLVTPNFPSYTSGHSTFSSAGAAVLGNFFGTDNVSFTTGSDFLPGVRRTFPSFSAAAVEAGQSRIYGGIHFQFDNQDGLTSGHELGDYVTRNFLTPIAAAAGASTSTGANATLSASANSAVPFFIPALGTGVHINPGGAAGGYLGVGGLSSAVAAGQQNSDGSAITENRATGGTAGAGGSAGQGIGGGVTGLVNAPSSFTEDEGITVADFTEKTGGTTLFNLHAH